MRLKEHRLKSVPRAQAPLALCFFPVDHFEQMRRGRFHIIVLVLARAAFRGDHFDPPLANWTGPVRLHVKRVASVYTAAYPAEQNGILDQ
jgi:hypothetical protein